MFERRRGGKIEQVEMRCKQKDVCEKTVYDNLRPLGQHSWDTECNQLIYDVNGALNHSVCRKCFAQTAAIDDVLSFIETIKIADAKGEKGLSLEKWMISN